MTQKYTRFPEEIVSFIEKNAPDHTVNELLDMVNGRFKPKVPYERNSFYQLLRRHNIQFKKTAGRKPAFNEEETKFILDNYKDVSRTEMVKMLKEQFGKEWTFPQVSGYYTKLGIRNKDRYGCVSKDRWGVLPMPDDTIRINANGRLRIKKGDKWVEFTRYMYQKYHPDEELGLNDAVIQLDGDIYNFGKKNLEKVSPAIMAVMNRMNLFSDDPEITKTGVLIARARCIRSDKIREKEKRKKE